MEKNGKMISETTGEISVSQVLDWIENETVVTVRVSKKIGKNCFKIDF